MYACDAPPTLSPPALPSASNSLSDITPPHHDPGLSATGIAPLHLNLCLPAPGVPSPHRPLVLPVPQIERVVERKPNDAGSGFKYLVKWEGLPYSEATWETEEDLLASNALVAGAKIEEWQARQARLSEANFHVDAQRKAFKQSSTRALQQQPAFLEFGKLRDYQLDGLNWMVYSWSQDRNVILADEMVSGWAEDGEEGREGAGTGKSSWQAR